MKEQQFKAYLILPNLIKQAQSRLSDFDKQNKCQNLKQQSFNFNESIQQIPLKNTPKQNLLKIQQSEIRYQDIYQQSQSTLGLGISVPDSLDKPKEIKNENQNILKDVLKNRRQTQFAKQKREQKQNILKRVDLRKGSKKKNGQGKQISNKGGKVKVEAAKKKNNEFINKVLRDIKQNKRQNSVSNIVYEIKQEINQDSIIQDNKNISQEKQLDFSSRNSLKQQIKPVYSFVQQMIFSQKVLFDPQKFQTFLKNIKNDHKFQKSLRAFIFSYFLQHQQQYK